MGPGALSFSERADIVVGNLAGTVVWSNNALAALTIASSSSS